MVYGHYYRKIAKQAIHGQCPNCGVVGQMQLQLAVKVDHIMFIPCWASQKQVWAACDVCLKEYYADSFANSAIVAGLMQKPHRWYHFTGTIIILLIVAAIAFSAFMSERVVKEKLETNIERVSKGQVIFYKLNDTEKTCMYVHKVSHDTVFVFENKLSTPDKVNHLDSPKNYSKETNHYTKEQLKQMHGEGRILDIYLSTTLSSFNPEIFDEQ